MCSFGGFEDYEVIIGWVCWVFVGKGSYNIGFYWNEMYKLVVKVYC